MKVGDKVKVVCCVDNSVPILGDLIGSVGTLTKVGNGKTVETMCHVSFDNGTYDAFWPEELSLC